MEGLAITMKSAMHVLVLLHVLGGVCVSSHEKWCYDLPSCGPETWGSLGSCSGSRQSPINIITSNTLPNSCLGPINFVGYDNRNLQKSLTNTGHYPEVEMWPGATIFGDGLPAEYYLKSYHFHFGTYCTPGSEHTINGKRYSMELHIVHTKNNMSMEEAKKDPDGVAVLAFFIQKSKSAQVLPGWNTLGNLMKDIPQQNDSVKLNGEFSPGGLLSREGLSQYYRYRGSLTTPNCSQSAIWTVFSEPIQVPQEVVQLFTTSLYFTTIKEGRRMQNNFRPVQPLNDRKVFCFNENAVPDYVDCYRNQDY
ncbi:carbonic anhydrase 4-like [Tiliqua scincoides]|uniref:carbonic anhydrase 4-like n=1 Tax=Tiliqua scincoides TaxID=71010 RepID=UPI0034625C3D